MYRLCPKSAAMQSCPVDFALSSQGYDNIYQRSQMIKLFCKKQKMNYNELYILNSCEWVEYNMGISSTENSRDDIP